MSIDPRISLGATVAPQVNVADIFNRVKQQQQGLEIGKQNITMNDQAIQQQAGAAQDTTNNRVLKSVNDFAVANASIINEAVNTKNPAILQQALVKRRAELVQQGLPTETTDEGIAMLGQGNIDGVVSALSDSVNLYNQQQGQGASAGTRERNDLLSAYNQDPNSPAGKSAGVALGITPRAGLSAIERISTNPNLGTQVAEQKGAEATAVEDAKLTSQLSHKPAITKAIKLAEKEATERGETLTDLARMEAGLPGIKEVVNELVELSSIATSTLGGRAFDFAVKESGLGSTKGADARAKLIAIVDNQVLPLLRETFGAAFTAKEGETLKDSLVNPSSSPSQKKEQLASFLSQKERNIRTKQTQLGITPTGTNQTEIDITDPNLTIEQLMEERKRLGGK